MSAKPNTRKIKTRCQRLKEAVDEELLRKESLPEAYVEMLDSMGIEIEMLTGFIADMEAGPDEPIKRSYTVS